jgi:hypothetical protein
MSSDRMRIGNIEILHQALGDAIYSRGWYCWRDGEPEAFAGPFETQAEAIQAAESPSS